MKVFYSIVVIIGIIGMLIGFKTIYVGQDFLSKARGLASISQLSNSIQNSVDQLNGDSYTAGDNSLGLQQMHKVASSYKEKGQNMMFLGVVISAFGLLFILFGKAKFRQVNSKNEHNFIN